MSEQNAAAAVEGRLNDTASGYFNVLLSDEAARALPARIFLREGPAFVISPRMDLPAFLNDGEHTLVVINATEYRELAAARSRQLRQGLTEAKTARQPAVRLGLSTIERDPEVADFLRERFQGGITLPQLRAACLERFGAERTPSETRISVFRRNTRRVRGAVWASTALPLASSPIQSRPVPSNMYRYRQLSLTDTVRRREVRHG